MISQILILLSSVAVVTHGACCYTATPQFLSTSSFNLNIAATTNKVTNNQYTVKLSFPVAYITDQEFPKSLIPGFTAQKSANAAEINTWTATPGARVFNATWRLFTPGNPSDTPTVSVSILDETCQQQKNWCSGFDDKSVGPSSTDNDNGKIDLGALGKVEGSTFWPVLAAVLVTIAGLGYVFYSRRAPSTVTADVETAMTRGGNSAGMFGEKKSADVQSGSKAGNRTSMILPVKKPQEAKKKQRPQSAVNMKNVRQNDTSDSGSDGSFDMSRVVSKKPAGGGSVRREKKPAKKSNSKPSSSSNDRRKKKPQQPLLSF
jgi:hypothetical protein